MSNADFTHDDFSYPMTLEESIQTFDPFQTVRNRRLSAVADEIRQLELLRNLKDALGLVEIV